VEAKATTTAAAAPADHGADPLPETGLTVLLVEDDEVIRASTAAMVAELGCAVIVRADAAGALDALESHDIDILMTDRGLPGVSGDDLAREALAKWPELSVIFATGAAVAVPDPALKAVYLIKPYGRLDVRKALTQVSARQLQTDNG
jgi:CheY-like chemotaxis protein